MLAAGLRCWRQHCGTVRCHCRAGGATAVLLRCYCGGAAEAGRLHDVRAAAIYGMWFSVVLPLSLLLRTLLLLLLLLHVINVSIT